MWRGFVNSSVDEPPGPSPDEWRGWADALTVAPLYERRNRRLLKPPVIDQRYIERNRGGMVAWTLVFHITGLVFWVGSLLGVTHVLAVHTDETSPEARAALGRLEMKLLKGLAHPGAAIILISGTVLLTQDPFALRAQWLHFKLMLVVVMIALDLRVYFRAKAFNAGTIELRRGECMALHGVIALILMGILMLVLLKPFGQPVRGANSLGRSPVIDRRYSVQPSPEYAAIIEPARGRQGGKLG